MMSTKLNYLPSILLLLLQLVIGQLAISQLVSASEYVPPPTGPYKSVIVINNEQSQTGNSDQIYKFPSDSLIQSEPQRDEAVFLTDKRIMNLPQDFNSEATIAVAPQQRDMSPQPVDPQKLPELTKPGTFSRQYSRNPWAAAGPLPDSAASQGNYYQGGGYQGNLYQGSDYPGNYYQGNYYQGNMYNPQYAYPRQNPYANNNQNNFMNDSFNNMPSPWTVMPMQSFFSGK